MNILELRDYCLKKERVSESMPFGPDTLVFKAEKKIFLIAWLDSCPLQFNVKCDPLRAIELREEYPAEILPGYHMNKKHWNTVLCKAALPHTLLLSLIDDSYRLVLPSR